MKDKDPFLCRVLPTCEILLSSFTIYISDNQTKLATLGSERICCHGRTTIIKTRALVPGCSLLIMTLRVWEVENARANKNPCSHNFLIRRLENLYGKSLGGKLEKALVYYKVNVSFIARWSA